MLWYEGRLSHAGCLTSETPFLGKPTGPRPVPPCRASFVLATKEYHRGVTLPGTYHGECLVVLSVRCPCPTAGRCMGATTGHTFPMAWPCPSLILGDGGLCLKEWPPVETMSWPMGALSSRWDHSSAARPATQTKPHQSLYSHPCQTHPPPSCRHCWCCMWLHPCLRVTPYIHVVLSSQHPPSAVCVSFAACHGDILAGQCEAEELMTSAKC